MNRQLLNEMVQKSQGRPVLDTCLVEIEQIREELELARRGAEACFQQAKEADAAVKELENQLAAHDLVIERMREGIQTFIDEHEDCEDADGWLASVCSQEALHVADELLALHPSTEALRDRDRKRDAALLLATHNRLRQKECRYSDAALLILLKMRESGEWDPTLEVK